MKKAKWGCVAVVDSTCKECGKKFKPTIADGGRCKTCLKKWERRKHVLDPGLYDGAIVDAVDNIVERLEKLEVPNGQD